MKEPALDDERYTLDEADEPDALTEEESDSGEEMYEHFSLTVDRRQPTRAASW